MVSTRRGSYAPSPLPTKAGASSEAHAGTLRAPGKTGSKPSEGAAVSDALYAFGAVVHAFGVVIFIFFHPPKGEVLSKEPAKLLAGGAAAAISLAWAFVPGLRPAGASGTAAAALRCLIALVPTVVAPVVLNSSFHIFGWNPAAVAAAALLADVIWSLGLLPGLYNASPEYHNYQLAATLGALMCCSAANVVVVRLRWRAAESRPRRRSAALSPSWQPEI
ncbi:hypothetical protein EMIHUDRAFT_119344 [Emiliania huxleyi CCMP1516]|uniref:EamA domain-containing protein n=2 Tax=Emiliania huxleyi TaxID=2903 RepID=A0A0D3IAT3_EMIH1|nr:hypothetical protein EMIHUDRAFT_106077 [Emiliania huxleyi CCMP1516]XP_005767949.1 hypothetical protein EMIHUDRAFT_119344 [Emiliania huxleyi CCMP1516]EOD08368.1 hypothetical protein EMIHUDRAFT_106077 [Emiliania huxleyi CCMP1516]EOD15520.1 hypothetical protein EMIHUDRAFT_119344 [Emiliania huxleyi CCMP1516]|eukprot:XP_005760797.1 hypothetical protein EMIHUDRAFT_106077 [Emiliania huxleyi CCMP1516]